MWLLLLTISEAQPKDRISSEFTYQGRLSEGGALATGKYDLQFRLFVVPAGGLPVGFLPTFNALSVTNGLFTVSLDFGTNIFDGTPYWLETAIKSNGIAIFKTLTPRQALVATPYALHAGTAAHAVAADSVTSLNLSSVPVTNVVRSTSRFLMVAEGSATPHLVGMEDLASAVQVETTTNANILFVDALTGNDATAVRGRTDRPWRSVSNAVAAAQNGDMVKMRSGRYTNTLHYWPSSGAAVWMLSKTNIVVEGSGPGTELYGFGPGRHFVTMNSYGITYRDFAVIGNKPQTSAGAQLTNGLVFVFDNLNSRFITYERLILKDQLNHGISCSDDVSTPPPTDITVRHCLFENGGATNGVPGIGKDGPAVQITGNNWHVTDNVITNWHRGVELYSNVSDLTGGLVSRNRIFGVPYEGIVGCSQGPHAIVGFLITENQITGDDTSSLAASQSGIILFGSAERNTISGNIVSRFPKWAGIALLNSTGRMCRNIIERNQLWDVQSGIAITDMTGPNETNCAHNIIAYNQVDLAATGISFGGINNIAIHNQLTRCGQRAIVHIAYPFGGTNIWCASIGNVIADCPIGIELAVPLVTTNRVYDNHMVRVTTPILDNGTGTSARDNTP